MYVEDFSLLSEAPGPLAKKMHTDMVNGIRNVRDSITLLELSSDGIALCLKSCTSPLTSSSENCRTYDSSVVTTFAVRWSQTRFLGVFRKKQARLE